MDVKPTPRPSMATGALGLDKLFDRPQEREAPAETDSSQKPSPNAGVPDELPPPERVVPV
jgi:hypothetical protein